MKYGQRDEILQLTDGGLDIFRAYLPEVTVGRNFCSPFYKDQNASCAIYKFHNGIWRYKDFGNGGSGGDAFWFVGELFGYNLTSQFPKILAQIVQDLHLSVDISIRDASMAVSPRCPRKRHIVLTSAQSQSTRTDKYTIFSQPFTSTDKAFWGQYGIDSNTLKTYGVCSLSHFSSYNREGKPYHLTYQLEEPMYCYNQGSSVKIYRPFSKGRFFNAGIRDRDYVFGYAQLPSMGDCVLLTGGEKDVLSLSAHGIPAVCLNSETAHLPKSLLIDLSNRFRAIGVLYDMDDTGIRQSHQIIISNPDIPNLYRIELPLSGSKEEKDVSDYFLKGGSSIRLREIIASSYKQEAPRAIIVPSSPIQATAEELLSQEKRHEGNESTLNRDQSRTTLQNDPKLKL